MMGKRQSQSAIPVQRHRFSWMLSRSCSLRNLGTLRSLVSKARLLAIACTGLLLLSSCQVLERKHGSLPPTDDSAVPREVNSLPPITLGLEAPVGTEALGNEFLTVGHSDRLLDREVGDRIQQYWPLRELLLAFNGKFRAASPPLRLAIATCRDLSPETTLQPIFQSSDQPLVVCYDLLQQMDDYADDLSGSLTEQHQAVLDMFYFAVARELSHLVLTASQSPEQSIKLGINPLEPKAWAALNGLADEAALDQLTAQLPQHLQLQDQTAILSGTQWLFNQGHPLLSPEKLRDWTGQLMDESNYQAIICTAEQIQSKQFPFLEKELPAGFELASCPA